MTCPRCHMDMQTPSEEFLHDQIHGAWPGKYAFDVVDEFSELEYADSRRFYATIAQLMQEYADYTAGIIA